MCYGTCQNEIMSGKNIGECDGGACPPPGDICAGCGCEVENQNFCQDCESWHDFINDIEMEKIYNE